MSHNHHHQGDAKKHTHTTAIDKDQHRHHHHHHHHHHRNENITINSRSKVEDKCQEFEEETTNKAHTYNKNSRREKHRDKSCHHEQHRQYLSNNVALIETKRQDSGNSGTTGTTHTTAAAAGDGDVVKFHGTKDLHYISVTPDGGSSYHDFYEAPPSPPQRPPKRRTGRTTPLDHKQLTTTLTTHTDAQFLKEKLKEIELLKNRIKDLRSSLANKQQCSDPDPTTVIFTTTHDEMVQQEKKKRKRRCRKCRKKSSTTHTTDSSSQSSSCFAFFSKLKTRPEKIISIPHVKEQRSAYAQWTEDIFALTALEAATTERTTDTSVADDISDWLRHRADEDNKKEQSKHPDQYHDVQKASATNHHQRGRSSKVPGRRKLSAAESVLTEKFSASDVEPLTNLTGQVVKQANEIKHIKKALYKCIDLIKEQNSNTRYNMMLSALRGAIESPNPGTLTPLVIQTHQVPAPIQTTATSAAVPPRILTAVATSTQGSSFAETSRRKNTSKEPTPQVTHRSSIKSHSEGLGPNTMTALPVTVRFRLTNPPMEGTVANECSSIEQLEMTKHSSHCGCGCPTQPDHRKYPSPELKYQDDRGDTKYTSHCSKKHDQKHYEKIDIPMEGRGDETKSEDPVSGMSERQKQKVRQKRYRNKFKDYIDQIEKANDYFQKFESKKKMNSSDATDSMTEDNLKKQILHEESYNNAARKRRKENARFARRSSRDIFNSEEILEEGKSIALIYRNYRPPLTDSSSSQETPYRSAIQTHNRRHNRYYKKGRFKTEISAECVIPKNQRSKCPSSEVRSHSTQDSNNKMKTKRERKKTKEKLNGTGVDMCSDEKINYNTGGGKMRSIYARIIRFLCCSSKL